MFTTFLQLAHAGHAHCTRHEWYGTNEVVWGGAVFTFLQLAHAGDAHAMNATVLMGWCGVVLCSCSFNLHTRGMGLGLGWGGDVDIQLKSHTYVTLRSTPALTEAMSSPASASCANRTDQKGRKNRKNGACGPQMQIPCK